VPAGSVGLILLALGACSTPPAKEGMPKDLASTQGPEPPKLNKKVMDSVRLKNGEVLRGEIKWVRHFRIQFDSDEFNTLELDWDKVVELRSSRYNTVVLEDFSTVYGTILVTKDEVVVGTDDGPRRSPRADMFSLVPGERSGPDYWSGHLALGLSGQSGNTDQVNLNAQAGLAWRSPFHSVQLSYLANYGTVDGDDTVNNQRARGFWQVDIDRHWFVLPLYLEVFRDRFQNIDVQVTPAAAVGYNIANTSTLQVAVAMGLGWRHTEFNTASPGEAESSSSANWMPIYRVKWDVTSDIDLALNLSSMHSFENSSDIITHLDSTLSIDLIGDLDLDVTFQWDRVGDPQRSSSGDLPDQNDFRYSVGLGVDF